MEHNDQHHRAHILLITEGTYPYHFGGVSTWCDILLKGLPDLDFTLMSLIDAPHRKPLFDLPSNVVEFRPVPLWGVREILELQRNLSWQRLAQLKRLDTAALNHQFIPLFHTFLKELFGEEVVSSRLAQTLHRLYRYFMLHDFDATFQSRAVWDCFVQATQTAFPHLAARHGYPDAPFTLNDLTKGLSWLKHLLFPIAQPLPKVDIAHAAMVGVCTLVAIVAKIEYGAAFLLSEHGIYLRERYLAEASQSDSLLLKILRLRFALRMTELSYALADQISPCCNYNQRWERHLGATDAQLRTIYYGVDSEAFTPAWKPLGNPPSVVWVGRINPLKDLVTLLQAAAVVHQARPDIQFDLYGSALAGDEPYYDQLLALRNQLNLEAVTHFRGYTAKPAEAFNQGDLAILSSISEAFPFVILEAMLCGKPIVATDVGGVSEQISDCGITVKPSRPKDMGEAIVSLVNDPGRCLALGKAAREKAAQLFSIQRAHHAYRESYERLVCGLSVEI